MQRPNRILLIRPSALGDVCRTVPVLASLRAAYPEARIDWLVQEEYAQAIAAHPALDAVVPFPRRKLGRGWPVSATGRRIVRDLLRNIRGDGGDRETGRGRSGGGYDLVVDAQGLFRSGLLTGLSGAGVRLGYANAAEWAWFFYNRQVIVPNDQHAVDRMLSLLSGVGVHPAPEAGLRTPAGAWEELSASAPALERIAGRYLLVAPTSRWPGKRWPAERFDATVAALLDRGLIEGAAVVASESERDQCGPLLERAARDDRVVDLVGRTTVGGLLAAVERSGLVLANDSAAVHVAVGFDKPLVGLFGPTRVEHNGPWRRDGDVLTGGPVPAGVTHKDARAGAELMGRIGVERVIEACAHRLSVGEPRSVHIGRDGSVGEPVFGELMGEGAGAARPAGASAVRDASA